MWTDPNANVCRPFPTQGIFPKFSASMTGTVWYQTLFPVPSGLIFLSFNSGQDVQCPTGGMFLLRGCTWEDEVSVADVNCWFPRKCIYFLIWLVLVIWEIHIKAKEKRTIFDFLDKLSLNTFDLASLFLAFLLQINLLIY